MVVALVHAHVMQAVFDAGLALLVVDAAHTQGIVANVFVFVAVTLTVDGQLVAAILVVTSVATDDVNGQIETVILALVVDARVRVALIAMGERGRALHPLVHLLGCLRIIGRLLARRHIKVVQPVEIANAVVRRQNVALAAADLRWSQVLTAALDAAVVPLAVDVGGADVLVVHGDDVAMVAAGISFFVLVEAGYVVLMSVTGAVDAWEFLHLAGVVDILRRSVVLKQSLHVLIVAMRASAAALQTV